MVNVARLATMGEMAVAMAHELNQPLAAIANYASAGEHFLRAAEPDLVEVRIAMSEIAAEALRAGNHSMASQPDGQAASGASYD